MKKLFKLFFIVLGKHLGGYWHSVLINTYYGRLLFVPNNYKCYSTYEIKFSNST